MPTAYIMVGLPGTGKSTMVNKLTTMMPDAFVYSTDNLIEEWSAVMGWSYNMGFQKYISKAEKQMKEWLQTAVQHNQDIIWDQTNVTGSKRQSIISKLPAHYKKVCIAIRPPHDEVEMYDWLDRLKARKNKVIPDDVINRMMETYTIPSKKEGFNEVEIYDLYGNSLSVDA